MTVSTFYSRGQAGSLNFPSCLENLINGAILNHKVASLILMYVRHWPLARHIPVFLTKEIRNALVTRASPEDRHRAKWWRRPGHCQANEERLQGFKTKRDGWCHLFGGWGGVYQCNPILGWFAEIWFVSVCVICRASHSQGKDLLPLQLLSSSIINAVRNHCGPRSPSIPHHCRHRTKKYKGDADQGVVCKSLWNYVHFSVCNFKSLILSEYKYRIKEP